MMNKAIVLGAMAASLLAGTAFAQQAVYTWTGYGQNMGGGSNKCAIYKMTIDVTVQGNTVKGLFQQEGRTQRNFEATLGQGGIFKTKAAISNGNTMQVTGTIAEGSSKVLLEGYCKFDAKLTKKPAA